MLLLIKHAHGGQNVNGYINENNYLAIWDSVNLKCEIPQISTSVESDMASKITSIHLQFAAQNHNQHSECRDGGFHLDFLDIGPHSWINIHPYLPQDAFLFCLLLYTWPRMNFIFSVIQFLFHGFCNSAHILGREKWIISTSEGDLQSFLRICFPLVEMRSLSLLVPNSRQNLNAHMPSLRG